jgi:hypothetical protein
VKGSANGLGLRAIRSHALDFGAYRAMIVPR